MQKLLENKTALITGAASGIGMAAARLFAREGAELVLTGRNKEKGEALKNEICCAGGKADFFTCDIASQEMVRLLADYVGEHYGKLDILFNNAGIMLPSADIDAMPPEDWKKTFAVNLDGIFYMTRQLKDYLFSCKGTIINNASIAGMHSYVTGMSYAYSASKAAVIQFTRQLAKNYAPDGVRVNCVCPGIIDTPILGSRNRDAYAKRVPLGYVGRPEDVAEAVLFLASDRASYITGAVLPVSGGAEL